VYADTASTICCAVISLYAAKSVSQNEHALLHPLKRKNTTAVPV
jgi:hypothetical protein